MQNVKWLIQECDEDPTVASLIKEVQKQGFELKTFKYDPRDAKRNWTKAYQPKDCVCFYGSIQAAYMIDSRASWAPCIFGQDGSGNLFKQYNMFYLMAYYKNEMQNYRGIFQPYQNVKDLYLSYLNRNETPPALFIRPNDGTKKFAGQVITSMSDIIYLDSKCSPEDIVFTCPAVNPFPEEYRLVVVDGKIVTGSLYRKKGSLEPIIDDYLPESMIRYSQEILNSKKWKPDRMFVMDIVYYPLLEKCRVLEFNSISTSGLYACDLEIIVREQSRIVREEWEKYYG